MTRLLPSARLSWLSSLLARVTADSASLTCCFYRRLLPAGLEGRSFLTLVCSSGRLLNSEWVSLVSFTSWAQVCSVPSQMC